MPDEKPRWSLPELIDFETELAGWDGRATPDRDGGSRAAVMKRWLEARDTGSIGRRWMGGLGAAGVLAALLAAASGAGAVWGTLDRETSGVNVIWMLSATLVLPWILFVFAFFAWLARGRIPMIGVVGSAMEKLSLRFVGEEVRAVVERIRRSGELARVLAWNLARRTQTVALSFHLGAFLGLGAMVLFKHVGFFWETTTETALRSFLDRAVEVLALPWSWTAPHLVPDVEGSEIGRDWMENGTGWWQFSLLCLAVWGVLPRLFLVLWVSWKQRRALASLTFQAPQHRKLWRALTEVRRGEKIEGPVDGALVVTVGGAEPDHEALRPFLLQRLRMNPTAWESLGVLDEGREEAAREALAKAPAGIVLFAEGWSLAPRQMERALDEVKAKAGERRQVLLVGNPSESGVEAVTADERGQWERFVDGRKGEELELVFYERP
ncbi:DUF2868 domain-containing protein [Haloferula helveola]|uniref:DUF2868 domain-containing protein n=1 Tax=Haloferula helveola TaxID=490095 RepID=A0ABM7R8J5_9BACT|nr:DUF2868 domain-containing protein [Haloferula helveola]